MCAVNVLRATIRRVNCSAGSMRSEQSVVSTQPHPCKLLAAQQRVQLGKVCLEGNGNLARPVGGRGLRRHTRDRSQARRAGTLIALDSSSGLIVVGAIIGLPPRTTWTAATFPWCF